MKPYYQDEAVSIYNMDCREFDGKADVIITDPPYGLEFMGMAWDRFDGRANGTPREYNTWGDFGSREHPRKPEQAARISRNKGLAFYEFSLDCFSRLDAGWLFAFGGTRTWHRLACAIEDSGWQIRDTMMWLYGQGFPKGKNTLKPSWEPIIVARKYGDLDIDAARIGIGGDYTIHNAGSSGSGTLGWNTSPQTESSRVYRTSQGRWPANLVLDEEAGAMLDEQSGELVSGIAVRRHGNCGHSFFNSGGLMSPIDDVGYGDTGGASRFFYCAKASRKERDAGCENMPMNDTQSTGWSGDSMPLRQDGSERKMPQGHNDHPTVKPLKLMEWLIKLSGGQTILDPFMGSGTTLVAAKRLGRKAIGIEIDEHSCEIAANRCRQMALL